jgi:hypothetical protein
MLKKLNFLLAALLLTLNTTVSQAATIASIDSYFTESGDIGLIFSNVSEGYRYFSFASDIQYAAFLGDLDGNDSYRSTYAEQLSAGEGPDNNEYFHFVISRSYLGATISGIHYATDENNNHAIVTSDFRYTIQPVPVPAAIWLFASGLIGLVVSGRRMRKR